MNRSFLLSTFLFAAVLAPILLQSNYCEPDRFPKLARLELYVPDINGEDVIPKFDPDHVYYEVELPLDPPDTAVLLVQAQDATATIDVTYDSVPILLGANGVAPLTLAPTQSELKVTVTAEGGSARTYTVSIDRRELCQWVACDDKNECTDDICNPANGRCEYPAVADGSVCAGGKGACYGAVCNFVRVNVAVGPKEVVFDWTTDRCEDLDLPDNPARVVRAEDGQLVLFANNAPTYRVSRGPDFETLQHVCDPPALVSADLRTPESYENWEWIWVAYREGTSIHALISNEFHDVVAPTCKVGDPSPANPCWYNSVTHAVSNDGGRSFSKPQAPAHTVAPPPEVWTPPGTPQPHDFLRTLIGYHAPSNVVRGADGHYYALLALTPSQYSSNTSMCLMRTATLDDPASWRAWDGTGFNLHMQSPYVTGDPVPSCTPLPTPTPGGASLTYNKYLGQYMAVNNGGLPAIGNCGIYLWLSPDLIHWGQSQFIAPARMVGCDIDPQTPGLLEEALIHFPSIVDHADSTINFERPGRTPYLYYTRYNDGGLDRDLVRVPLKLTMGGPLCEGVDCNDQNACTDDVCNGADGSCEHTPIECVADFNDCTIETCSPARGCAVPDGTPCAGGMCQAGICKLSGLPLPCTEQGIRNAIAARGGPYTFACDGSAPVVTTAEIVIDNDVILDGEGKLIVDGNADHRVFSVERGVQAALIGFKVTGGATPENGGGILNAGTLLLKSSTVSGNTARSSGGLRNLDTGTLIVMNSTISQNTAARFGGGMHNFGQAELIDTTVSNNTAQEGSGGISNFTISSTTPTLTITRSAVAGNSTSGGSGGIGNRGTLTVTNSTVSGNAANSSGGIGNVSEGTMTLVSTTVARNSAIESGSAISNEGSATLRNTIIEGDCSLDAPLISLGGNIESEGNTCGLAHPTDQVAMPAPLLLLEPLAANGGPTMTHALLPGSEAINEIPEVDCIDADGAPLTADQRGKPRPAGSACDVGAFEVQP